MADAMEMLNIAFTSLFSLEVVLKLTGLGFKTYYTDLLNLFDFTVVVISWTEVFWYENSAESMGLTILRGFRLLRVFKLIRSWKSLRRILKTPFSALPEAANLFFLIAIYIFVNGLIGRQLFAGEIFLPDGEGGFEKSRYNFNSFRESMVTIFICLSGENWNEISQIISFKFGKFYCIFFMMIVMFGNFMLLNLFLAILLKYIEMEP